MNSWEIIKAQSIYDTRPETYGRYSRVSDALDFFAELREKLIDVEESLAAIDSDEEVATAIARRGGINELRRAGVL